MYLSRLVLNPRSRAVWRDLADCQQLHRTVMSAFPDVPQTHEARARLGVLHRVDASSRTGLITLLVQSRASPDWSGLPPGYLTPGLGGVTNPAVKALDRAWQALEERPSLRFRLRANPSRRIHPNSLQERDTQRWAGRRVELCREEDQVNWLHRQGERWGFQVLSIRTRQDVPNILVMPGPKVHGSRGTNGTSPCQRLTLGAVTFDGLLRISDVPTFRRGLETGIGPGKAYGFGLLSVAPVGRYTWQG